MRLLHIADVHLERPFRWLGHERGSQRRQELRNALSRAAECARERQVDAICIAGDLYERENATPATGQFLRATFESLRPIPVLIAPGNHDYFSPGCLYDRVPWPPNVRVFRDAAPSAVPIADGIVWGTAFVGPDRHESPLADVSIGDERLHVGLCHAQVVENGEPSAYGPLDPGQIEAAGLRFTMLGHVHAGRIDNSRRFAYPGSLEPLDVSEAGPRWALLVDVGRDGCSIEQIEIAQRKVLSDNLDVSGVETLSDLRHLVDDRRPLWTNHDVKLRILGTLRGELLSRPEAIREALLGVDVDLTLEARPAEDLDALARQQTVLGAFVREARRNVGEAADDAAKRRWDDVLAAGVAAFRGQQEVVLP